MENIEKYIVKDKENLSTFDDVVGCYSYKKQLLDILKVATMIDQSKNLNVKLPKGVLLYGNPGSGKTMLAEAFARGFMDMGRKVYLMRMSGDKDKFSEALNEVFSQAKKEPSIIILDDLDHYGENPSDEIFTNIQALIDSVGNESVFIIATVNKIVRLPDSLTRDGRFDYRIWIKNPKGKEINDFFAFFLKKHKVGKIDNIDDIISLLDCMSPVQIKTFINDVGIISLLHNHNQIEKEDFIEGIFNKNKYQYVPFKSADEERQIAYHEAGHLVIMQACTPNQYSFAFLSSEGSFTQRNMDDNDQNKSKFNCLISLAGRASEECFSHHITEGSYSDMQKALNEMKILINGLGMSDLKDLEVDNSRAWEDDRYGNDNITFYLNRYYNAVKKYLFENKDVIEKIVDALVKKHYLLKSDIKKIFDEHPVKPFPELLL